MVEQTEDEARKRQHKVCKYNHYFCQKYLEINIFRF